MDVIHLNSSASTLNLNAPMFVPSAYQAVEDFSDQRRDLVQSSPWFGDSWLQAWFSGPQNESSLFEIDTDIAARCAFYDDLRVKEKERDYQEKERDYQEALILLGALQGRKSRVLAEAPRKVNKPPKIVNVKVSPRPIQQPR